MTATDATVVLADDHAPMRETVAEVLTGAGFKVTAYPQAAYARPRRAANDSSR